MEETHNASQVSDNSNQPSASSKSVEIYSTPTCHYCNLSKEFFKANGIEYTEYNVAEDADKRSEMIDKSGQMGVPVIVIDGQLMIGFNEPKMKELLGVE